MGRKVALYKRRLLREKADFGGGAKEDVEIEVQFGCALHRYALCGYPEGQRIAYFLKNRTPESGVRYETQ